MTLDLSAIKARAEAATPGPWVQGHHGWLLAGPEAATLRWLTADDIAFITNARADIPALIAECKRLRALVREAYMQGFDYNSTEPDLREEHWNESDARARLGSETE